ncbi:hypothetical protein AGMMS49975_17290 [Clostridia bacterium]|nr:hypothetical protein AGMMS49975_17290 [Clostridia bacterium]
MKINRKICKAGLKNNPNKPLRGIEYVTIHTTGNTAKDANAKMHADYQFGGSGTREASWHYTVDADEIWQSFEDTSACWHAGDGNGNGNFESIAIEICDNDKAGFALACGNAAELAAELLLRYELDISRVKQHFAWSGKDCPRELRSGVWGVTWAEFLEEVKNNMAKDKPSEWAKEAWEWGVSKGIIADDNPKLNITKEQAITMLYKSRQ